MKTKTIAAGIMSATLVACSGSNSTSEPDPIVPVVEAPPQVNQATVFNTGLSKAGADSVSRFIKNGIYAQTVHPPIMALEADAGLAATSGFSTTNTHEAGVDEADRIEYDGTYLYVAENPQWSPEKDAPKARIRVLMREQDFSLSKLTELEIGDGTTDITGIYQANNRLSVVHSSYPMMALADSFLPWPVGSGSVSLDVFDTTTPQESNSLTSISIDGWLLSSRRIGDYVYLVTSYSPFVDSLVYGDATEEQQWSNYNSIQNTDMSNLMPKMHIGDNSVNLNQPEDCYIPQGVSEQDGYANMLTISRINTQQPDEIQSLCISAQAENMYMSENNLYLSGTLNNETVVHKIAMEDEINYLATGSVKGTLGWGANPQFRMHEKDDYLRIVTTEYQEQPLHQLHVLAQSGSELTTVAQLPNDAQPAAIGKPGEDIYAVRFIGDRGYIVTFERIDPLYVLDLSDPNNPQIAGELEIPGFSSYLQPLDNNYLLGIGQEVALEDINNGTGEIVSTPVQQGVKISLFDVTNPASPLEVNSIVKEDSYTPAAYDYRALSVLQEGANYKFALPLERWQQCEDDVCIMQWQPDNSLLMMDVATEAGGSLTEVRELTIESDAQEYVYGGSDRSILHGEHIYYLHGNQLWHSLWQSDAAIDGPY